MKLYQTQMKYRRVKNNSVGNGKKAKEGRWVANEKKKKTTGRVARAAFDAKWGCFE